MRIAAVMIAVSVGGYASAALPPPSDAQKALAAETAAKAAWSDNVARYQLCQSMDRTARAYRAGLETAGKSVPTPAATPPCVDPGPYSTPITPLASKPLEASGAHSPPGAAISPPSTKATAAEIGGGKR